MIDLAKTKGLTDWPKVRRKIEDAVGPALGELPREHIDLQTRVAEELEFPGYVRRRINFFVDNWTRISAWEFIPDGKEEKPAILCCHQQTPFGKDEPAGVQGEPHLAFARHYAEQGYVTLAPDCVTAGDRVATGLEPFDTVSFYKDHPDMSILGKMLVDHMRSVDLLLESRIADGARIGVVGHGLGAVSALLLGAYDERVQTCVASCGFTRFADDKDPGRWARDSGLVLLPKLAKAVKSKTFPFDWEHVLALIAPCPTLIITALNDDELPSTKSCATATKRAQKIYKLLGAQGALDIITHREGRQMDLDLLAAADDWFERWL